MKYARVYGAEFGADVYRVVQKVRRIRDASDVDGAKVTGAQIYYDAAKATVVVDARHGCEAERVAVNGAAKP